MIKVSVVTATCRLGYLPIVALGLAAQAIRHHEFEWIIVDDNLELQAGVVETIQTNILPGVKVTHIYPEELARHYAPAAARNTGFREAKGDVVYYCNEYIVPGPHALERHHTLHGLLLLRDTVPALVCGTITRPLPNCPITLRPDRVTIDSGWRPEWVGLPVAVRHPESVQRETQIAVPAPEVLATMPAACYRIPDVRWWWAGRNDSIMRDAGNKIRRWHRANPVEGWKGDGPENEAFDGGWGYPDQVLALDCQRLLGSNLYFDTISEVMEVDHPRGMGKAVIRTERDQQALAWTYESAMVRADKEVIRGD